MRFFEVAAPAGAHALASAERFAAENALVAAFGAACDVLGVWRFKLDDVAVWPGAMARAVGAGHLPEGELPITDFIPVDARDAAYVVRLVLRGGMKCTLVSDALQVIFGEGDRLYLCAFFRSDDQLEALREAACRLGLSMRELPKFWADAYDREGNGVGG